MDRAAGDTPGGDSPLSISDWFVSPEALTRWANELKAAVLAKAADAPSDPSLSMDAAMKIAGIPARSLVRAVADRCGLEVRSGRIWLDGVATSLGDVEAAVRALQTRLVSRPFAAPSSLELDAEGLGSRHVAAAVRAGRLMRHPDGVVLLLAPTRLGFTAAESATSTLHRQPSAPGTRHHAQSRDSLAELLGLPRVDPPTRLRQPRGNSVIRLFWARDSPRRTEGAPHVRAGINSAPWATELKHAIHSSLRAIHLSRLRFVRAYRARVVWRGGGPS